MTKELQHHGIIIQVYAIEDYGNSLAITVEDFGAESLVRLLESVKLSLNEFLDIAIRIAEILGEVPELELLIGKQPPAAELDRFASLG